MQRCEFHEKCEYIVKDGDTCFNEAFNCVEDCEVRECKLMLLVKSLDCLANNSDKVMEVWKDLI